MGKINSREKDRSNPIIATGKTIRSFELNNRKMDQILTTETHGRKKIERKSYAEILKNGTGAIKRPDEFNTEGKNITAVMKKITENRNQRKKKKYEKKEVRGKHLW